MMVVNCYSAQSQQNTSSLARNTFYTEVSSKASVYTVNYDRIFSTRKKTTWTYRIGFSVEKEGISMPVGINLLTGLSEHHAEFSFTLIPYVDHYKQLFSEGNRSDKYLYIVPAVGYRYQKPSGGLFVKTAVSPLIFLDPPSDNFWNMDPKFYIGFMAGIGYSF